ncbi:hypothetical protein GCM10010387_22330 [Streptomyces inusitatus]|uniref:Uncharacterized protein n=1 Tax=Streptomyces inusitatus TaxID=68221 RepID=A0A918PZR7_9ACTN|nr:hypothetical protein [Streptomyces inusitatus]GGZ28411.1 hypothetical protein GCM10010387_22330 [Streptomyces inusitatus]
MSRLTFTLDGRDQLSRVLNGVGDSADRLGRRMLTAGINGEAAMNRMARTTTQRMAAMQRDTTTSAQKVATLRRSLISLAPAAIPAAAALAPIAAGAGAAGIALGVFAAALGPQAAALGEAAEAEKQYQDAVETSGARSKEAATAQAEYARTMAKLPPATRQAAAALGVFKDEYKSWSDSLAGDTMAPVTKGMATLSGLLPKTSGLVRGTSAELDRMVTILAGGMQTAGFDRVNAKFEAFATGTLRKANDALISLGQADTSKVGSGLSEFMDYARAQAPLAGETLRNLAEALTNLLIAGSDVGVGLLQVVNVLAGLAAAVPSGVITTLLQLAIAIKAVQLAAVGMAAGRAAIAALGVQLVAMNTAASAAPGRLAAVGAGFMALSRSARLAVAGTGIGLLLLGLNELSQAGRTTGPDVDRLTTSLGQLGRTGKTSGTLVTEFGADFEKLREQIDRVLDPSVVESVNNWGSSITGGFLDAGDATEELTQSFDAIDSALANLVSGGKADQAAAALDRLLAGMGPAQAAQLKGSLDGYNEALAALKFEQELAAQAMGLFGQQAQATQAKLAAQKQSADGLRQSIVALNDVQRGGLGGMIGFEAAIAATAKAATGGARSLSMVHGELNLTTERARTSAAALQDLAAKTDAAAASTYESTGSWEKANDVYARGRAQLVAFADAMGLTRGQAEQLADQILKTPDKTATITMRTEDAVNGLNGFIAKVQAAPNAKSVTVKALTQDAVRLLESLGYKVTHLKNGQFSVTALTGTAMANLGAVQRARDGIQNKSITITTTRLTVYRSMRVDGGGTSNAAAAKNAAELYADGGLVRGPGTGTSDSIDARVSNGEYVVKASSVARHGVAFMDALNEGRLPIGSPGPTAPGGGGAMAGSGADAGRGLAAGMRSSTGEVEASARTMAAAVVTGVRAELEIASPSKKMKALAREIGNGLISGMTGSRAKIKSTAKELAKDILAAVKGTKKGLAGLSLVARISVDTKELDRLASQRDGFAARIKAARDFAKSVTTSARQSSSLAGLQLADGKISAGSIKAGLTNKLGKLRTFASHITALAKRGLSKTLLRQILEMGPEEGYAYASALAGADKATFKSINSLQGTLSKETDKLGKTGADLLYDSGKNAGKGFLKGLESQQDAIEAQMVKIAKAMQKAIRKALGIKSPSRVMAADGQDSTKGLAVGLIEAMPVLDQALAAVSGRIASTQPVIGRPAITGSTAGTPQQVRIDVHVSGSADPVAVARELRRQLVELRRTYGINVALGV